MQVFFGDLTALDVNVFNDTTTADNDRITCVTPDYSQQGEVPPVTVDVTATNMTSGKTHTLSSAFIYGDPLWISGNSPSEGGLGDLVIIYGSGFEDPLQVFLGEAQMEVVSVSGTELVVRIPDDLGTSCGTTSGSFKVLLLETNQEAEGGNFTINGNNPLVLSVAPVFVAAGDDITINGMDFAENLFVEIAGSQIAQGSVDRQSETTIFVTSIPGADALGLQFDTTPCTLVGGEPGQRLADTAVGVSVINLPGNCENELPAAIVVPPWAACPAEVLLLRT